MIGDGRVRMRMGLKMRSMRRKHTDEEDEEKEGNVE